MKEQLCAIDQKVAIEMAKDIQIEQTSRCSGHCCVAFILTIPLDVIKSTVEKDPKGVGYDYTFASENFYKIGELNPTIMLIPEVREANRKEALHSCRQFDHATRNCKVYDKRPPVCKAHPHNYGHGGFSCHYEGCTYKSAPVKVMSK